MITFFIALILLIVGYFVYGKFVETVFHPDERSTPCVVHPDGVDFCPISKGRAFLIQLLNIAGLGPIFGALSGAIWGPSVYLWIVLGTIFAGGVHDYLSGMLSLRNDGASISEITGKYLGTSMKQVMRVFSVILLVMVGVVFMVGSAGILAGITGFSKNIWVLIVLAYFFCATLLPIDKLIGKLYPIFGICLIIMAIGVGGGTVLNAIKDPVNHPMVELTFQNFRDDGLAMWPFMFITVACGAISGFHATQSPLVARCVVSEKEGRQIFYGAMVAEGIIALIWASAGIAFYYNKDTSIGSITANLAAMGGGNSTTVMEISKGLLGPIGGVLAVLGVVACPITSGDTAFRSARLTIADWFKIDQVNMKKRLVLTIPLLLIGYAISFVDYSVIWRYFSWSNQTLAMIALWAAAVYLHQHKCNFWIAAIPATFMSAVSITYFLMAPEIYICLASQLAYPIGIVCALALLVLFWFKTVGSNKSHSAKA
ncbi:MAG: carbon starvation protein A [Cellulosilyticum sp.]|nr:carbon starvation protein A [Cellulosilyticum sp.]